VAAAGLGAGGRALQLLADIGQLLVGRLSFLQALTGVAQLAAQDMAITDQAVGKAGFQLGQLLGRGGHRGKEHWFTQAGQYSRGGREAECKRPPNGGLRVRHEYGD